MLVAGSLLSFYAGAATATAAALVFAAGSCTFLALDVRDLSQTRRSQRRLRGILVVSIVGLVFYVVGSIAFLPDIVAAAPAACVACIAFGSALLAVRYAAELTAMARGKHSQALAVSATALAMTGAVSFLLGSWIVWQAAPAAGSALLEAVFWLWLVGSLGWTLSGVCQIHQNAQIDESQDLRELTLVDVVRDRVAIGNLAKDSGFGPRPEAPSHLELLGDVTQLSDEPEPPSAAGSSSCPRGLHIIVG